MMRLAPILLLAGLAAQGCAVVDQETYVAGDTGTTTFSNPTSKGVHLGGCSIYGFEKQEPDGWSDRGPAVVCVSGEVVESELLVPDEAGRWRLVYPTGLGCVDDQPLDPTHCERIVPVYTKPFEVIGLCDPRECGPPLGMPNILCPDGEHVAGPTDRCLRDPDTKTCGWEILSCPD
jgi:hypothetical protein